MSGTSPALTYEAGTTFVLLRGAHETLSSTVRNLKLSNPGSTTVTVKYALILGT